MIEIFERLVETEDEKGEINNSFKECSKLEATHKHICRHDEGKSCSRIKL